MWQDVALALARQIGGDRSAADAALQTLIEKDAGRSAYQIAEVYALRNDAKATFAWLDRAWSNRDPGITYLLYDPFILRYKDDPRFAAFCRKVGLPVPGEAPRTSRLDESLGRHTVRCSQAEWQVLGIARGSTGSDSIHTTVSKSP